MTPTKYAAFIRGYYSNMPAMAEFLIRQSEQKEGPCMTCDELRHVYEENGYDLALAVLEDAELPGDEEYRLQEQLESWEAERWFGPAK